MFKSYWLVESHRNQVAYEKEKLNFKRQRTSHPHPLDTFKTKVTGMFFGDHFLNFVKTYILLFVRYQKGITMPNIGHSSPLNPLVRFKAYLVEMFLQWLSTKKCSNHVNWLKKREGIGIRKDQNDNILKHQSYESACLICSFTDPIYNYLSHIDWLKDLVTRRH